MLTAAIYLGNAVQPALLDDADASHAIVAREMLQRGDWTVMFMDGVRYLEKAPLHYWLVAASYAVFGQGAFQTRLPLALSVVGLALMIYVFSRRFFGERAGFYGGLIMATSLGTYFFTRIMIPEAIFALEMTAIFYLFLCAWNGQINPRLGYWGAAALTGLAVLTLGLVGVIFPVTIIGSFIVLTGGLRRWRELPVLSSTLLFLAIAAPWHLLAEHRAPGFLWSYFINEHVLRALGTRNPPDYEAVPLWLWWIAHLAWLFPWSFFGLYALREFPRRREWKQASPGTQARLLCFLWASIILVFFSFTGGSRMEYYSFGAWPAMAILLGLGLTQAEERSNRGLAVFQGMLACLAFVGVAALAYFVWLGSHLPTAAGMRETHPPAFYRLSMARLFDLSPQNFADLRVQAIFAMLIFVLGFGGAWWLRVRRRHTGATVTLALTLAAFLFCANSAMKGFEPQLSSRPMVQAMQPYLGPGDQIILYGDFNLGSSVAYYTKRQTYIYNGRKGTNLEIGSRYADVPPVFINDRQFAGLWSAPGRIFLFVPAEFENAGRARVPADSTYVVAEFGGKTLYVNHPLTKGQPTLAELRSEAGQAASAQ